MSASAREFPSTVDWRPGRLWSLWVMINFMIPHYISALKVVYQEISLAQAKLQAGGDATVDNVDKERIQQNFKYVLMKADQYGLVAVHDRLERIFSASRSQQILTLSEVIRQMQALLEAFEDDTKFLYLFAYPKEKVKRFMLVQAEWEPTIKAFPSLREDLEKATDLYALGHNLACVFYVMRVAEIGVQRFGKKLGVSLTKLSANRLTDLTWHQILDATNPKLKALPQTTAARKAKYEKLSAIQNYLYGVKDAWRNPTMHPRKSGYSDLETLDILNHVRSFMNELSSIVSPKS
jgi:hypothetical protein